MEVSATPQFKRNEGQDGGDEKATNERRDGEPPSKREEEEEEEASSSVKKDHKKYRRDKPWDTAEINHWKEVDMKSIEGTRAFSEESSFATLFPQYREKYLREVWKVVTNALDKHGIACELNLIEGSMTVRTTRKTRDPVIIFYARDLIKLLSRSVPVSQALKILNDDMLCDIVKINGYCGRNKEKFIKRRDRLIGPKGSTLKALELLTECYILVQGNTVCCMGKYIGLRWARNVIEDCMLNVHPVYNIKILMIKRELVKDPVLKDEMWDRFLPKFKKTNSNTNKKKKKKVKKEKKKEYQAFPPLPQPSKVDLQLESGEYFMSEDAKRKEKASKQMEQRELVSKERQVQKDKVFQPPTNKGSDKKRPRDEHENDNDNDNNNNNGEDVLKMAERVKKKAKKARKKQQK